MTRHRTALCIGLLSLFPLQLACAGSLEVAQDEMREPMTDRRPVVSLEPYFEFVEGAAGLDSTLLASIDPERFWFITDDYRMLCSMDHQSDSCALVLRLPHMSAFQPSDICVDPRLLDDLTLVFADRSGLVVGWFRQTAIPDSLSADCVYVLPCHATDPLLGIALYESGELITSHGLDLYGFHGRELVFKMMH